MHNGEDILTLLEHRSHIDPVYAEAMLEIKRLRKALTPFAIKWRVANSFQPHEIIGIAVMASHVLDAKSLVNLK